MPIIFPSHCRNVTAGALREIRRSGITTASGGLVTPEFMKSNTIAHVRDYARPNEPLGVLMSTLENTRKDLDEMTDAIGKHTRALVDASKTATKEVSEASRGLRESVEKLGVAMDKFNRVSNNPQFMKSARAAEQLVNALERLAELEASGMLDRVMKAMSK